MLLASNGRIGRNPIMFDSDSYYEKRRDKNEGTAVTSDIVTSIYSAEIRDIEERDRKRAEAMY